MKENSKEKLERQLNENPELKERFNLQMKSITESVKETTAPFEGLADSVKALENLSLPLKNIMNSFKAIKPTTATQSIVESLELFNLRLKPLLDSITSDEHKEMILLMDKTKIEYTSLRKSEREFIEHERLYIPNDVYEATVNLEGYPPVKGLPLIPLIDLDNNIIGLFFLDIFSSFISWIFYRRSI